MALQLRRQLTRALIERLGPNRSLVEHAVGAGITLAQYTWARLRLGRVQQSAADRSADVAGWLEQLQRAGYCVVPNFYSADVVQRCREELERILREYPQYVQHKSDQRVFGVESASPLLREFAHDPRLLRCAQALLREPTVNAFTLGNRIDYRPGNRGSGEGWHRDSFVVQFKALLYLSDVEVGHGPFQLIADSEKLPRLAADMLQARLGLQQNRVDDAQVERLLERRPERLRTFTAPAGTLLLANTSAIHRGQPLERGSRYALTNYYVQSRRAGAAMDAHFAPVLRKQAPSASAASAGATAATPAASALRTPS